MIAEPRCHHAHIIWFAPYDPRGPPVTDPAAAARCTDCHAILRTAPVPFWDASA